MQTHEHKQISPRPLAALGAFTLLRRRKRPSALGLGLALLAMQGTARKTRVDSRGVSWTFGLSLPLFEIPFDQITGVFITRIAPWGFGINWMPHHGWLWKISGRDAVTIRKKNGGIVTLGSDDAAGLFAAITSHTARA